MSKSSSSQAAKSSNAGADPVRSVALQRQPTLGVHHSIQREATGHGVREDAPELVHSVLNSPGRPLEDSTRSSMEPRFGRDLSGVRVHTDDTAAESARAVSATAYTAGSHVVFGERQYSPGSVTGQSLLAHELTHVVQQAAGPVAGTPVAEGLTVSHHSDAFERAARATASQMSLDRGASNVAVRPAVSPLPGRVQGSETHIQRADPNSSLGLTTGQGDTQKGANQAAALGAISGGVSALAGVGSFIAALVALRYASRQAAAAEDPPVAEPTTGGVTVTHVELPEVKGFDVKSGGKDKDGKEKELLVDEGDEEMVEETEVSGLKDPKHYAAVPEDEKTSLSKALKKRKYTKKTVTKSADDADQEKSFTVLRLQQDAKNVTDFLLTLRYNGKDVRGGATAEGGQIGYLGGTAESNASVIFRSSPAGTSPAGTGEDKKALGTVRLLFGGTNVPPRKKHSGGDNTKDYIVQRFSGAAKFAGDGTFKGFDTLFASPKDRSVVERQDGTSDKPLVTIGLTGLSIDPKNQFKPIDPSGAPKKDSNGPPTDPPKQP